MDQGHRSFRLAGACRGDYWFVEVLQEDDGMNLDEARVDPQVLALRPDYRALLITVEGISPGASDEASEAMLVSAETSDPATRGESGETSDPAAGGVSAETSSGSQGLSSSRSATAATSASRSPATASKPSYVESPMAYRGSIDSPTSITRSASRTSSPSAGRIYRAMPVRPLPHLSGVFLFFACRAT